MGDLLSDTKAALYATLSGNAGLTTALGGTAIYDTEAPQNSRLPYLVYNHQGGGPLLINPSPIEENLWFVRVYSGASMKNAETIFALADALLDKTNPTITGVTTCSFARETNLELVENQPNAQKVFMRGGIYRLTTDS